MSWINQLPAATLLRAQPGTPLAATRAGQTVHVLNRSGGRPLCGRSRNQLTDVDVVEELPPPMRVCCFCSVGLPAALRAHLDESGRPTEAELSAVHENARRQTTTGPGL